MLFAYQKLVLTLASQMMMRVWKFPVIIYLEQTIHLIQKRGSFVFIIEILLPEKFLVFIIYRSASILRSWLEVTYADLFLYIVRQTRRKMILNHLLTILN